LVEFAQELLVGDGGVAVDDVLAAVPGFLEHLVAKLLESERGRALPAGLGLLIEEVPRLVHLEGVLGKGDIGRECGGEDGDADRGCVHRYTSGVTNGVTGR